MRTFLSAFTALAVLTLAVVPAADAAKRRDRCAKRGTTTVEKNRWVRVYEGRRYTDDQGNEHRATYACYRRKGRRMRLDNQSDISVKRLAGVWLAYVESYQPGLDAARADLHVVSVKRRSGVASCSYGGDFSDPIVARVVLRRDGASAWVAQDNIGGPWDVRTLSGDGECGTLLDSGTAIEPSSLTLRNGTLSWLNGGATRTAPIGKP